MDQYTELKTWERNGLTVTVCWAPETIHPGDCFDDSIYDIEEICSKIDRGIYDWFILRATVSLAGAVLATEHAGGLLYYRMEEVFEDGVADSLVEEAISNARASAFAVKTALERFIEEETL